MLRTSIQRAGPGSGGPIVNLYGVWGILRGPFFQCSGQHFENKSFNVLRILPVNCPLPCNSGNEERAPETGALETIMADIAFVPSL
jgi:hypothetical protein